MQTGKKDIMHRVNIRKPKLVSTAGQAAGTTHGSTASWSIASWDVRF